MNQQIEGFLERMPHGSLTFTLTQPVRLGHMPHREAQFEGLLTLVLGTCYI